MKRWLDLHTRYESEYPRWRIENSWEGYLAALLTNAILKNDLSGAHYVAQSATLGMFQHQPAPLHQLVGPFLAPNRVSAVLIEYQRGAVARRVLVVQLELQAAVFSRKAHPLLVFVARLFLCHRQRNHAAN